MIDDGLASWKTKEQTMNERRRQHRQNKVARRKLEEPDTLLDRVPECAAAEDLNCRRLRGAHLI